MPINANTIYQYNASKNSGQPTAHVRRLSQEITTLIMMWYWILGWFFAVVALLGNALVFFLVISKPGLHTTTNWIITSLAVADFCFSLTFFPYRYMSFWNVEIDLSHAGLWYKICFTFLYASTTNLCVLTADRYLAVVKPLKYASFHERGPAVPIALAWLTPIAFFTLPAAFSYRGNDTLTLVFETNRIFMFQVSPSIFFLFVTFRLIYIARKIARQCSVLAAQIRYNYVIQTAIISKNLPRLERRSIGMIITIITLFNITFAGGNYICYCFLVKTCVVTGTLRKIITLLYVINSAANPIVYALFKKDIKRELRKLVNRRTEE